MMTETMLNKPNGTTASPDWMIVETWQVRALLRIVAECRDPSERGAEWFADLAERAGIDPAQGERLNPKVAA
jgi:hypothetical protein